MQIEAIVSRMTLEEKASLLSGKGTFTAKSVDRLDIPGMFLSDGPHGLRKQAGAADHLGLNASLPATCFPTAATMANSWDPALGEELGTYLGEEAVAQGVSVLLGPGLNMKRSPLCGRNFEYFSEDPYLAGKMAAAYVRGIQSKGVSACPKHFAANSQETLRMHNDSVVDMRTLREIYLTGFEIAVKEGHPMSIMSAYNRINGVYANEDKHLLQDLLVDEWGFDGFVVTDWGGSNDHVEGVRCGSALEMPAAGPATDLEIINAVREGRLEESVVDARVKEYLKVLFATRIPENAPDFDVESHHAFARKAAESTIVLLKNEEDILPLKAGTKVAVLGDFAVTPRYQGAGSSMVNVTKLDTPADCLKASSLDVVGVAPGFDRHGKADEALKAQAVELAGKAQVVLLYMGLDEISESEGLDRAHMKIHDNQVELLKAVAAVNPNVVVVLCGGSPIEMPWLDQCKAMVHGYLGGQAGAGAVVDVLTGAVNPSGKLAETWPMTYEDTPAYHHFPGLECTTEYREGPYIGYRYYATAGVPVRFPFGFGLSYTTFAYSDLTVAQDKVTFTVTNTGARAGAEVAQVYVSLPGGKVFRPVRELKGFTKVFLEPGESKSVTVPLDDKAFRYFNTKTDAFEVESGTYTVEVGPSSVELPLTGTVEVKGTDAVIPWDAATLPHYYSGQVQDMPDGEFEALLGRPIPPAKWDRTKLLTMNDTFSQLFYAKSPVGRLVYSILTSRKKKAEAKGTPDLNILFIYNMPFRGMAKMMGGMMDMAMAESLLEVFNGHFFKGLGHLLGARSRMNKNAKALQATLDSASDPS